MIPDEVFGKDHFQIHVFRHPLDKSMRFGQVGSATEHKTHVGMEKGGNRVQRFSDVDVFINTASSVQSL